MMLTHLSRFAPSAKLDRAIADAMMLIGEDNCLPALVEYRLFRGDQTIHNARRMLKGFEATRYGLQGTTTRSKAILDAEIAEVSSLIDALRAEIDAAEAEAERMAGDEG